MRFVYLQRGCLKSAIERRLRGFGISATLNVKLTQILNY